MGALLRDREQLKALASALAEVRRSDKRLLQRSLRDLYADVVVAVFRPQRKDQRGWLRTEGHGCGEASILALSI